MCRFCNAEIAKEVNWHKVEFLLSKYKSSVELDHHLNPKFVCRPCADQVQENHKRQLKHDHFKRQKYEKKFLPKFVPSATDCMFGKCDHIDLDPNVLKAMWGKMNERRQCEFLAFSVQDLKSSIVKDITENFEGIKDGRAFSGKFLDEMDLMQYLKGRDKRVLTFILAMMNRNCNNLGDDLPKAVILLESIYHASCGNIMPYSFTLNLILYKKVSSKFLSNLWGNFHGGGNYTVLLEWLKNYSDENPASLTCFDDVVIATDNEQKLGKTYVTSIHSTITTSVISVIVAFFLNLQKYYQYVKTGCTSFWRYGEKEYTNDEKKNIMTKALEGRVKG